MLNKLKKLFAAAPPEGYQLMISEIEKLYSNAPVDSGGGCSYQKAMAMAMSIKEFQTAASVDIGVYRGRSLFPQAIAHKYYSNGIAYGVDPYHSQDAIQNDRPDIQAVLDEFVQKTDFEQIYKDVKKAITENGLANNCALIRKRSADAVAYFNENNIRFGLIHIDGNHDASFVMEDVNNYFPLTVDNGIIVMDDISWEPVKPALDKLKATSTYIGEIIDAQNDFAIFVKGNDANVIAKATAILKTIKNYSF